MFNLVRPITFDTSWSLGMTDKCGVSPLPAILILGDTRVHIYISYGGDVTFHIEAMVDQSLGWSTTLWIPYIDPHYSHIWFQRYFDNMWFWSDANVIEDLCFWWSPL